MCGIAAFSVPDGANVNARELAHSLLTQIENRGTHASGFAWYGADGSSGFYKQPKPGSQLSLGELPRDAKTVILHTRYATQGSKYDNRNNHPVLSTENNIALVHNGVISNDYNLRGPLGITQEHGEVDSLVIPSIIEQHGVAGLSRLGGYAAIAWLDNRENGELHIARLKSSPVAYTHLPNGTFVMASTAPLLELALLNIGQTYGGVFDLAEGKMIDVVGGFIMEHESAPRMTYDYNAYRRHSSATAGGHGATGTATASPTRATGYGTSDDGTTKPPATVTPIRGTEDTKKAPMRILPPPAATSDEDGESCENTIGAYYEDLEKWREQQGKTDIENQEKAVVFAEDLDWDYSDVNPEPDFDPVSENWDGIVARLEQEEAEYQFNSEGFYIVDQDGGMEHFPTLEDLEGRLRWYAKMSRTDQDLFPGADDNINWVNHIMDIGSVTNSLVLESWVEDTSDIDNYESAAVRNLQYIREGSGYLAQLKGA